MFDTSRYLISLNRTNLDTSRSTNNRYIYNLPRTIEFKKTKVALTTCNLFFSWFNITSAIGNNTLSIEIPEGASSTTLNITIPDGYYTTSTLNAYLQSELVSAGYYLVNSDGDFVYYIEIIDNLTRYVIQYNAYVVPTTLPSGWTNPGSWSLPTTSNLTPATTLPSGIGSYLGFDAGTYPSTISSAGADYSKLSDNTPEQDQITSVVIACSVVSNRYVNPSDNLYSFSPSTFSFGQLINERPNDLIFVNVNDGYARQIVVEFRDQLNRAIQLNDTDVLVELCFEEREWIQ